MSESPPTNVKEFDWKWKEWLSSLHRQTLLWLVKYKSSSISLTLASTTTTISDTKVASDSVILITPMNLNMANEVWYISSQAAGQFILTHANSGTTRTYRYIVI